jgi:hypothetical protein
MAEEKKPEYRSVGEVGGLFSLFDALITSARKGVSRLKLGRLGKGSVLDRISDEDPEVLVTCCRSWLRPRSGVSE